jgi:hypothetical protein
MRMKVHGGTVTHGATTLCATCSHSTIIRGCTLDDEIVECRVIGRGHRRITFKVTSCSAYNDARLPSLMQMLDEAWVLRPGSTTQKAGFIRGSDLRREEMADLMCEITDGSD